MELQIPSRPPEVRFAQLSSLAVARAPSLAVGSLRHTHRVVGYVGSVGRTLLCLWTYLPSRKRRPALARGIREPSENQTSSSASSSSAVSSEKRNFGSPSSTPVTLLLFLLSLPQASIFVSVESKS